MKRYEALPVPSGRYTVGRTQMDFKFKASDDSERELTAIFFYPADSSEGKPTAEYAFPEFPQLWDNYMAASGVKIGYRFNFEIQTWCYEDVALSNQEERYPVVFYNHGGTTYPEQNTAVCQELASEGYIVVSVAHPGSGAFRMKDGRVVDFTEGFLDTLNSFNTQPAMIQYAAELMGGIKLERERALELSRLVLSPPESLRMGQYAELQSEDLSYVADCLYQMDSGEIESMFKGRLRLDLGLGSFGHSFGGATSAIVARKDDRFVCAIDYDGGMMGSLGYDMKKPFLMIGSTVSYNLDGVPMEENSEISLFALLSDVVHFDFGDFAFTANENALEMGMRGPRDPMDIHKILTTYTKAFFDKYLLKEDVDIESISFDGVELFDRY